MRPCTNHHQVQHLPQLPPNTMPVLQDRKGCEMTIGKEGSYQAQPRFWGPVLVQELLHDAHWDQESLCSVLNVKSHTSGVHGYGLAALLWRSLCYFQLNPSRIAMPKMLYNRAQAVGSCVRLPSSFMSSSYLVAKLHSFLNTPNCGRY